MSSFHHILTAIVAAAVAWPAVGQERAEERAEMVETIKAHAELAPQAVSAVGLDPGVFQVMRTVPRHEFVPEDVRALAYEDRPLPIGYGQTISQPFIVALMTDLLDLEPGDKVLEIVPGLGERAAAVLEQLDYANVETKVADGYYGWPEAAPFDGIVVTAAASYVPPPLIEQLKPGGRMIIPIGGPFVAQQLMLVEKREGGGITTRQVLPVQFVPFTRAKDG